mmetsp:Transcript_4299/g.6375  ORF Transcript_4299/g.6375 Transcript_4299/m.6375 type:complete len:182 (-) Transcript_4299:73-618(-)
MKLSLSIVAATCLASAGAFTAPILQSATRHSSSLEAVTRKDFVAGALGTLIMTPLVASADSRPTYLTEPTDEFKANEEKAMEFKRKQLIIKKKFTDVIERFMTVSKSEKALVEDLNELQDLVIQTGGMPLGIKKEDIYKQFRKKKAAGYFTVKVEIAYQALIREISYQQSPNTEKDEANPL